MVVESLQRISHVACHSAFKFARFSFAFSTSDMQRGSVKSTTRRWRKRRFFARSSLCILFIIVSIRLAFESLRKCQGTEFRGSVSKLGNLSSRLFTFSVKVQKWSFHVAGLPKTGKKYTEIKKHVKGVQSFCFCSLSMRKLWRCRCRRVVGLNSPFAFSVQVIARFRVKFGRTVVDCRLQIGFKMQTYGGPQLSHQNQMLTAN